MSTRSTIALLKKDGTTLSVYCHSDGYTEAPHGVGFKLTKYYNDPRKIRQILKLGNASFIGNTTEESCFYTRDRNEDGQEAKVHNNDLDLIKSFQESYCEYLYIYNESSKQISCIHRNRGIIDLPSNF